MTQTLREVLAELTAAHDAFFNCSNSKNMVRLTAAREAAREALVQSLVEPAEGGLTPAEWKQYLQQRKDFEAGVGVVQPPEPRPPADAGHPLLQRLIDSIEIVDGVACWDFLAMYEVRNALAGAPVVEPQPPSALTTFHQAWAYAKANAGMHSDGYRKDAFVHVQFWLERMPSFGAPVAEPRPLTDEQIDEIFDAHQEAPTMSQPHSQKSRQGTSRSAPHK